MDAPEVHPPHVPHRRGTRHRAGMPRWLELAVAVTALITSISSIAIAIEHGHTMQKLVEANSMPYLEGAFSDSATDGSMALSLDLLNRGVGPAHEESLHVNVDDHAVRNLRELLLVTLGPHSGAEAYKALDPMLLADREPKRFVPAGASQFVFKVPRSRDNAHWWDLLNAQERRWTVEFCYCSVFDECWLAHGTSADDTRVKECTRDPATEFVP